MANFLRPYIKLLSCNPATIVLWHDSCIFDIPIAKKPTFLNMSIDNPEELLFSNLSDSNGFCATFLRNLVGNNFDWNCIESLNINESGSNLWVWRLHSSKASIASTVYEHANSSNANEAPWLGWLVIWKLPSLPRVKVFLWKLAHGRIPTGDYLYQLNIGHKMSCPLCGLVDESAEHLFWNCPKIRHCWQDVFARIGWNQNEISLLSFGNWIFKNTYCRDVDLQAKALFASVAWIIWKSRCNLIFNNRLINFSTIVPYAWTLCYNWNLYTFREFSKPSPLNKSKNIFTNDAWSANPCSSGFGFIIIYNMNHILAAGSKCANTSSPIIAEFTAIILALQLCISNGWLHNRLFCDCPGVAQLLKNFNVCTAWHINEEYQKLKRNLVSFPHLCIEIISTDENEIADALATFGRTSPQLSLFFQGLDWPQWHEDICSRRHFIF